jgi:prephenate dehydratase/chorismate mutase/prephenate dehydratase
MELGLLAGTRKTDVVDPKREIEVLERVRRRSTGVLDPVFAQRLYGEIIRESKVLQRKGHPLIAFQGEHGAYGEAAALAWNPDGIPIPCRDFSQVFDGVSSGVFTNGLVPVENSIAGAVEEVKGLLLTTDLYTVGTLELPIRHCLLTLPETDRKEIRAVYSHPQALAQCREFLRRNRLEPVPYYDTGGAAKMLVELRPEKTAVIAGRPVAAWYDLTVIREGIEDDPANRTRFLVLAREERIN